MGRPLVLVPGHGVCLKPQESVEESAWIGIHVGEAELLVEHARAGVEAARAEGATLIFSGGQTRHAAGPRSEAQGYWDLAEAHAWWGHAEVQERAHVEGFARDSLENLAFGLARFHQLHGEQPSGLWVCGWGFKEARFDAHRRALGWAGSYRYLAVNDPPVGPALEQARRGEAQKCAQLALDPLLQGELWSAQRAARDPFGCGEPYTRAFGPHCQRAIR